VNVATAGIPHRPLRRGPSPVVLAGTFVGFVVAALLSAAGAPLFGLIAAVAVPTAAVLWSHPDAAVLLVMFMLYTNANVVAVKFHGVPMVIGAAVPALLLIPLWRDSIRTRRDIVLTPIVPLLFAFVLVQFAGAVVAVEPVDAVETVTTTLIEGLALYILVTNTVRTREELERVIWALLAAGVAMGLLTMFQHFTDTYSNPYYGFAQIAIPEQLVEQGVEVVNTTARQAGPLGETNRYAQIMGMLLPLSLTAFTLRRSRTAGILAAAAIAIIGSATVLTLSRGIAVGLGITFLVATVLGYVRIRYMLFCLGLGAILALVSPRVGQRVETLMEIASFVVKKSGPVDDAVRGRATEMLAALEMFTEHPILGVGPGMYKYHYQMYARRIGGRVHQEERRSHNLYLDVAAENGLAGLVLLIAMGGLALRDLRRAREALLETDPVAAQLATGFFMAILAYFTTALFLHAAFIRYLWMIMALGAVASRLQPAPSTGATR